MFLKYSELLNSLDSGATAKITINNRRINKVDFRNEILLKMQNDDLDKYREEYNNMLISQVKEANEIIQEKIITITAFKKSYEDARNYFSRIGGELSNYFNNLGSKLIELDTTERIRMFHDFFRTGEETAFYFDLQDLMRKGHDFKDKICPDSIEKNTDYLKIGNRYARVVFLKDYANFIKDSMVDELTELNRNMMLSIDLIPIPMDEAIKEAQNRTLGIETNISRWFEKQNKNGNFNAVIPYDMQQQREESKAFLDDLITRDQRMFLSVLSIVITANSKEELDNDTDTLNQVFQKGMCEMGKYNYQQLEALNTVLPYGRIDTNFLRTLTTESLAVFIPFKVQEIRHNGGIFYGQNVISKNMIIIDRKQLMNANSFILGVSGSGKSFTAKQEIASIRLKDPNADIIIIDPEREYSKLVKAFGGEIIKISATSKNHINAMDMNADYGEEKIQ